MSLIHLSAMPIEQFLSDKCEQYAMLTASFVRRFKFLAGRDSSILFDLYDKSYTMDLEDFNRICKIPHGVVLMILLSLRSETLSVV